MQIFQIPEDQKSQIRRIMKMGQDELKKVVIELSKIDSTLDHENLKTSISRLLNDLGYDESEELCQTIYSIHSTFAGLEFEFEEFVDLVVRSVLTIDADGRDTDSGIDIAKANISQILRINRIFISVKALSLLVENQDLYQGARILTDVRPVFSPQIENQPVGSVIFHNLRISYSRNQRDEEIYFALDKSDLVQLQRMIDRAIRKSDLLKEQFSDSQLSFLEA